MKTHTLRQVSVYMLESGSAKGTQGQGMADTGKPAAYSWRWCSWSRRHSFFFILVLASVLFLYNMNLKQMAADWNPNWWMRYNATRWWVPFKIQTHSAALSDAAKPGTVLPGTTSGPTAAAATAAAAAAAADAAATAAAGPTAETSSSAFTRNVTTASTNATVTATTTHLATNGTVVTQRTTQEPSEPPATPPYVSPGPYLVEYPYQYHFVINEPKRCEQEKPFLVLMVPVGPANRAHRDIIRSTWGGEGTVLGKTVGLFFVLGLHTGEGAVQLQEQLLQESREHRDLIQSDFLDCYKNLTIKTMVMLEWLDAHCPGVSYAMKIDSDMFLNVDNLVKMLLGAPKTNYMTGLVAQAGMVLRDPKSKWYLPVELYPHPVYPPYALGLGYVLSLDLPRKLVETSRHVKAVYIEDAYLGMCMKHMGIAPTNPPDWGYFNVVPVHYSRCAYSKLVATTTYEYSDRVWMWKDFKRPGPYC